MYTNVTIFIFEIDLEPSRIDLSDKSVSITPYMYMYVLSCPASVVTYRRVVSPLSHIMVVMTLCMYINMARVFVYMGRG